MSLPPLRRDGADRPYRIAFVCLGNICRSPMAHVVFAAKLADSDVADLVDTDSSGTGDWHVGDGMDGRAAETLAAAGYDPSRHRAQQFDPTWFDRHDLVVAMDLSNRRDILAMAPDDEARDRVRMLRDFDPSADGDLEVPDPWYGGQAGFDHVLAIVERSTDRLLEELAELLAPAGAAVVNHRPST